MAVQVECTVHEVAQGGVERAHDHLVAERVQITRWAREWTRFDDTSELMRINAAGRGAVSVELFEVVEAALHARTITHGRFDPTMGAIISAHGYDRTFADIAGGAQTSASAQLIDREAWATTPREVSLDRERLMMELTGGARLDLGGIAKGWMADALVKRCGKIGTMFADVGGDMACAPRADGRPWDIDVVHHVAGDEAHVRSLEVTWGGVATSGVNRRRWVDSLDRDRHHIIDPRTGDTAHVRWSTVTVVAATCVLAETFATASLLADEPMLRVWARAHDLVIVATDHRGITTEIQASENAS